MTKERPVLQKEIEVRCSNCPLKSSLESPVVCKDRVFD